MMEDVKNYLKELNEKVDELVRNSSEDKYTKQLREMAKDMEKQFSDNVYKWDTDTGEIKKCGLSSDDQ